MWLGSSTDSDPVLSLLASPPQHSDFASAANSRVHACLLLLSLSSPSLIEAIHKMSQDTCTPMPNYVENTRVPYACPLIGKIFPTLEAAEKALAASCYNDGFNICTC
ncbi:hypothetical protein CH063_14759 [Colletotrichum higginsianum]|uniref:Uncharacterized protein n=1 Tax=Colletotrichum higginsianum (strain IMI 349063) TaxID=759273 RepID=H1VZY8_COLHI|nr:hypothetical protein CH063_14759 [Colletotrichum higginsianum]